MMTNTDTTQPGAEVPEVSKVKDFKKIINPGTVEIYNGKRVNVFCKIKLENGNLSISGVIGPTSHGDAYGSCGQIDMEFAHENPEHNDRRNAEPIQPEDINFSEGWDKATWYKFLETWKVWHLNDMRSGCEHQRALGWRYEDHDDPKTFRGENCPVCGYSIGSKWLKDEVPGEILNWLKSLPSTTKQPAWV